jgi:hypothetical protein
MTMMNQSKLDWACLRSVGKRGVKLMMSYSEFADEAERMMRMVRNNNFTQQTNALDTDKHMCVEHFFDTERSADNAG